MKKYEIEHIGICVEEPIEMAKWYQETLGFNIKFSAQDEEKGVAFTVRRRRKGGGPGRMAAMLSAHRMKRPSGLESRFRTKGTVPPE